MDGIAICFLVIALVLALILLVLLVKYLSLRAELKAFREQLNEIRNTDRKQPIKVASFSAPSVELAKEINLIVGELREAAIRSADEERRIRTIMAGVSHDFRTPITAADGYLQLAEELLSGEGTPDALTEKELSELRDYLKIVNKRIRFLRALSDEFFEVTYLDAKKDMPLSEVRLDILLSEVLLAQNSWIEEGKITTDFSIPEEQLTVIADRHYLERILENLFSNARKYTKSRLKVTVENRKGGADESLRAETTDTKGKNRICLLIENDMQDTQEMDTAHIFEPFYRAKGRSGPGTGLGLYVCKELSEAMHFEIEGNVTDNVFQLRCVMPAAD